ncbi:MAG: hypothetical protein IPO01_13530 [Chitinophagaceae bacterium]|nr:hypothetical protein [Chitinophagaceae bacterium]
MQDRLGNPLVLHCRGVSKLMVKSFTQYTEKKYRENYVRSIMQDRSENIWFGTKGNGVSKHDGKSFSHLSVKEGLGDNFVPGILKTGRVISALAPGVESQNTMVSQLPAIHKSKAWSIIISPVCCR